MRRLWREKRMFRKDLNGHREFYYYYCNWWCFLTNQRHCSKPSKKGI